MNFWTPGRETALAKLVADNLSASQIGAQLGCSRNAVIGKIIRGNGRFGALSGIANGRKPPSQQVPRASGPARAVAVSPAARSAGAAKSPAAPALSSSTAVARVPMPFLEAVERGRCLYFAGDPYAPSGPDMPVCGDRRADVAATRYCAIHLVRRRAQEATA